VLDQEPKGPVVLMGGSLGGAIALETAAEDSRISLAVAIAAFSDLRRAAKDRTPFFIGSAQVCEAFRLVEAEWGFAADEASPLAAAPRIRCPVLLVHGAEDHATPPSHSKRIFEALTCPKELILVPGLGHDDPLDEATWQGIDARIEAIRF
jgi:pimeloyl-ACP methyl ester carboxylesterase